VKHTLAVLVENQPGVLSHVAGLFARRGYNIESQASKQLNKQVEVIKVNDITNDEIVVRQLLLLKVAADLNTRQEIMQIVEIFRCRIVDIGKRSLIVEATGDEEKIQAIIQSLRPFGIQELVRTGNVAMVRGVK